MKKAFSFSASLLLLLVLSSGRFGLSAQAEIGDLILPDGSLTVSAQGGVQSGSAFASAPVSVSPGETIYSYEGMTVYNNGGEVYNHLGTVFNNAGTVYNTGGTVFNNGGIVYANSGVVFLNGGTVYNNEATVYTSGTEDGADRGRILGYYELKLADYYEPYVTLDGVTTEPGSEKMIISEDSVCHVTPKDGYRIAGAESGCGDLIYDEDGSVFLVNVTGDTTLRLEIE